jgi:hypothetical protein
MWSLNGYKNVFVSVSLIGVILLSAPSASMFIHLPGPDRFSQLYILGARHTAEDYPFNTSEGVAYSVFLGVINNLGNSAYYEVELKLRNSSDKMPDDDLGIPSPLPILYRYEVFLTDEHTWETTLNFSFSNVVSAENISSVGTLGINGASIQVNKSVMWDSQNRGYFYQLVAELWQYNATINTFNFDDRFVALWLNVTSTT